MMHVNLTAWDARNAGRNRRELTYDLYPDDKRSNKARQPVNYHQVIWGMGYADSQIEYDVDPGNKIRL